MEVTIIGTGYVGLTTGVCLAEAGHRVSCIDVNEEIVSQVNRGNPHIYEPNLNEILNVVLKEKT